MDKKLFNDLVESMTEMNEIIRGERAPAREFHIYAHEVKDIRARTGLSQPKLAKLMNIDVGTLRNWEQGRREPTGPAKALLKAIAADAEHVLKALATASPRPQASDKKRVTGKRRRKLAAMEAQPTHNLSPIAAEPRRQGHAARGLTSSAVPWRSRDHARGWLADPRRAGYCRAARACRSGFG